MKHDHVSVSWISDSMLHYGLYVLALRDAEHYLGKARAVKVVARGAGFALSADDRKRISLQVRLARGFNRTAVRQRKLARKAEAKPCPCMWEGK